MNENAMKWSYDWNDTKGGIDIFFNGNKQGFVPNGTSKHGADLVGVAMRTNADSMQVSHHGCGRISAQFFNAKQLVSDFDITM